MFKVYSKKFNINYIFKNYFDIVVIIFIPLIFAIIFFLLVNPTIADIKKNTELLISKQQEYNDLKYKQSVDEKKAKALAEGTDPLDGTKLNTLLPNEADTDNVMVIFEDIARNSSVELGSIFPNDNPSGGSKLKKIDITANISAVDLTGVKIFLENIENNARLIDIKNFSLNGGTISLGAIMYYYKGTK